MLLSHLIKVLVKCQKISKSIKRLSKVSNNDLIEPFNEVLFIFKNK